MDSLPNFLTHGAPLCARFARARSSAIIINVYIISGVQYYTGQFFDIKRITAAAQKKVTMHVSLQLQATIVFVIS